MLRNTLCAFLAPAVASAMAMPWAGPEPTLYVPDVDGWSPAPTPAPQAHFLEFAKRQDPPGDNTCGYLSGSSVSSLTCNNVNYVCATNSFYGVHGCCNPLSIASCSIPTTCIPSSLLVARCTGACSANSYIAKCTNALAPYCYQWHYVYPGNTVMTEYGCASEEFTSSVSRLFIGQSVPGGSSEIPDPTIPAMTTTSAPTSSTPTPTSTSSESETPTPIPEPSGGKKKTNVGAIAGGTVGGVVVLAAAAIGLFFILRRRRKQKQNATGTFAPPNALGTEPQMVVGMGPAPGVTEFKPQPPTNFPPSPGQQFADLSNNNPAAAGYYTPDNKPGFQQQGVAPEQEVGSMAHPYSPPMTPAPQYSVPMGQVGGVPTVAGVPEGVAEAGGEEVQPGSNRESIQRQSMQSGYQPYQPGQSQQYPHSGQPGQPQQPIYEAP